MIDVSQDALERSAWVAAHAASLRRLPPPAPARSRRRADPAAAPAKGRPAAPTALRDANARPLALLDYVQVGGPNAAHGIVEILAFSVKDGRSVVHYGVGFPESVSFWCYCSECAKAG